MKPTTKSTNGTSFHDSVIRCSVETLRKVLGEPTYDDNSGDDKVNYEWEIETSNGDVFTVYDWKEYRPLNDTDIIEWHIGGHNGNVTEKAKMEIREAIVKI